MPADASRDLLFGLLALQNGLIDQGQLVAAFQAWTIEKGRPLADHLAARGGFDAEDRAAVEALVARHLKKHGGSAVRSLAAIPAARSMQRSLAGLDDPDLAASLTEIPGDADSLHTIEMEPVSVDGGGGLARLASGIGTIPQTGIPDGDSMHRPPDSAGDDGDRLRSTPTSRYHLLDEIARGGMGAVHRGRDLVLGRDLALKLLLEKHRDRADLIARFVEEAQICGQLQHPGIVPVYELGTLADKRPFFAMKLVKGSTLADLLETTSPGSELPRLLSIFEAICQTVAYAHARRVIHRDLKPANVMVGSFGEVQVMDWGLAKVLPRPGETPVSEQRANETVVATARSGGDSDLSQSGSVLGTPAYMAPEQARGELDLVDRRGDVFALGSILCEILTGKPAFVGASTRDVLGKASRAETADALARLESCNADDDLLALARDCLAAERQDRPADAGIVAERLTAYLAGVQTRLHEAEMSRAAASARAEAAEARASAERRARRLVAALAATVIVAGVLGGGGWRWVDSQRRERIQRASERVNVALQEATHLRALAQAAPVGDVSPWELAVVAAGKARDLLEPGIDPALRKQVKDLTAGTAAERDRAQAASRAARRDRTLLETLVDIRSAEADDRGGWATDSAYTDAFRQAGLDLSTMPALEAAEAIRSRPPGVATSLAIALDDWAAIRRERTQDRAGAAILSAVAAAADPDDWRSRLRMALDLPEKEARLKALRDLARAASFDTLGPISLDLLGRALGAAGDRSGAESVLRRAQERHPDDVWINYDLALTLQKLARRDEAIRFATAARALRPETAHELAHMLRDRGGDDDELAILEDLTRLRPGNGRHLGCLGRALKKKGRRLDAARVLASAEAAGREAVRRRPNDAYAHASLGLALSIQEKHEEAIAEYRAAVSIRPDDAHLRHSLGQALDDAGRLEEAIAEGRTAIRIDPENASAHIMLGSLLGKMTLGDRRAAAAELREAIRLEPDNAVAHTQLGAAYLRMMMLNHAIEEYRVAERLKPGADSAARVHLTLARIFAQQGKLDEAIAESRIAVAIKPDLPDAKNGLAWYMAMKRVLTVPERTEILERAREAVALTPRDANAINTLALAEYRAGHWNESIAAAERSLTLEQGLDKFDWFAASEGSISRLRYVDASNWFFLAMAHWQKGDKSQARSYFAKAVSWTRRKDPTNVELIQFWGEAAELLGEPGPGPASPPNLQVKGAAP